MGSDWKQVVPGRTGAAGTPLGVGKPGRVTYEPAARTTGDIADLRALLADTAARHHHERPDVVLRHTSITSATKGTLHRPSKPLRPYSGIRPDLGVDLPTASTRLAEITEQASAPSRHRGHTMDIDFLTASFDPHKWDPYFDALDHMPASLLGHMLHQGIDPHDRHRRGLLSESLASGPVLREDRI